MSNRNKRPLNLYNLGHLPARDAMLFFHALAFSGEEALVIVSPQKPLISVGYFQKTDSCVDLSFCKKHNLPVMRRMVGGGTTLLDADQVFYQLVIKPDHPLNTMNKERFYLELSKPAVNAYRMLGVETRYRAVNDIVTVESGKKIAGQGGGEIGECLVFVGGMLLDFQYELMSRVLKVPDEKFRDKVYKSMQEGLTTLKRELGVKPSREKVVDALIASWEPLVGGLTKSYFGDRERSIIEDAANRIDNDDFLFMSKNRRNGILKVAEGSYVYNVVRKTTGGLVELTVATRNGCIRDLSIAGDFMAHPASLPIILEMELQGVEMEEESLTEAISSIYRFVPGSLMGISPAELAQIILDGYKAPRESLHD